MSCSSRGAGVANKGIPYDMCMVSMHDTVLYPLNVKLLAWKIVSHMNHLVYIAIMGKVLGLSMSLNPLAQFPKFCKLCGYCDPYMVYQPASFIGNSHGHTGGSIQCEVNAN